MPRIHIYDTTLRDGSQGEGVNFSLQDKLLITQRPRRARRRLHRGRLSAVEPQGLRVLPGSPQAAAQARQGRRLRHDAPQEGVRAEDDPGLKALLDAQTPVVTIVGKTWDLHVTRGARHDARRKPGMIADSVALLQGRRPRGVLRCRAFLRRLQAQPRLRPANAAGRPGRRGQRASSSATPTAARCRRRSPQRVDTAEQALRVALGIHCHNDCDVAVANSLAAVADGATQVQGTINGIGERCGNADLVSVIANLALKRGYEVLRPGSVATADRAVALCLRDRPT